MRLAAADSVEERAQDRGALALETTWDEMEYM